jgi:hypothetical protein
VNVLTAEECLQSTGRKCDLLYEFDDLIRRGLVATQRQARNHRLDYDEFERACITLMMTIVASAAVAANKGPEEQAIVSFSALASDAFTWATRRSIAFAVGRQNGAPT